MADYATTEQIQAFARESDGLADAGAWDLLATAASRAFDTLCEVPEDFFAEAPEEATEKVVYGSGTAFQKLPPYVPGSLDLENATMGEAGQEEPLPDMTVEMGEVGLQFLVDRSATEQPSQYEADLGKDRYVGFYEAVPITLEARWGFETTPADIKLAVIGLALYMWRQSDPSFAGISNADTNLVLREMPPSVSKVVEKYRTKYSSRETFA